MPARLSAAQRIRAQIEQLFASEQDLGLVLEQVARLSVRLVIQAAVEAEVTEFLGRERYARGERERAGYRNGHAELTGSRRSAASSRPAATLAPWCSPAQAAATACTSAPGRSCHGTTSAASTTPPSPGWPTPRPSCDRPPPAS